MPQSENSSTSDLDTSELNAEQLRDFAEAGSDWFFELDKNLKLSFITHKHENITGIPHEEMIGKTPWEAHKDYIDPVKEDEWQSDYELMQSHKDWKDFTFTFKRKDGQSRVLSNSAKAIFDNDGVFQGYRGAGQDITEKANMETQLNSIVATIPDAIITIDQTGLINSFSHAAEEIFGFTESDIVGENVSILMPEPHRTDHDEYLKRYLETDEKRIIGIGRELEARRKDGSLFPIHLSVNEMLIDGQRMFTGVIHDMTDLKKAQGQNTRVGKILDRSLNEIYLFDAESLKFVQVNFGARKNMGYSSQEFRQMTPVDIKPDYSVQQFSLLVAPLREGQEDLLVFKTRHQRKDSTTYPVEIHLQLMRNEFPPVFLAVIQDITEIERREAQLRQSQKMEAIGQLTGGIAHDFNNLMTVVIGNNELLLDNLTDEFQRGLLEDSTSAAEHAAQLTNQLLAFSRQQPLDPQVLNLNELIEDMAGMLKRTLGENIKLQTILAPDIRMTMADPAQVHNAVLNLAINARDAMPSGGDLVIETSNADIDADSASIRSDASPGRYVRLSVRDTGSGMTTEVQERVLDPFFTTKKPGKGTGLGLSMVHGFAKQSEGFMEIYSEVGFGTAISFYLPQSKTAYETEQEEQVDSIIPSQRIKTILVVEDDARVRSVTLKRLAYLGYKTIEAESGQQALNVLSENSDIDLVFSDMVMPGGMTGGELLEQVRKLYPHIKRLITSGYAADGIIPNHGTKWLRKPYSIQEMTQVFQEALK